MTAGTAAPDPVPVPAPPGPRRRAVLHIGTEKTGSTTIQTFLAARRAALPALGVAFPRAPGESNHLALAAAAGDPAHVADLVRGLDPATGDQAAIGFRLHRDLARELAALPPAVHTVLFSAEHLHSRLAGEAALRRLKALLDPFFDEWRIVLWLRRQDEVAVSHHSTLLRAGHAAPSPLPGAAEHAAYFDYAALLDRWAAVFGRDAVRPRLFGRAHFTGGDLLRDALDAFGLEALPPGDGPAPVENARLDAAAQHFLAALNAHGAAPPGSPARRALIRRLDARFAGAGAAPLLPSRAEARAFLDAFRDSNERLRATWFPGRAAPLFDEDLGRYPEAPSPPAGADAAAALATAFTLLAEFADPATAAPPTLLPGRPGATMVLAEMPPGEEPPP